jgi:hypothetical protein
MLKPAFSFVLGSSKSSTYPRGYASGFDSPAALLNGLFEHPAESRSVVPTVETIGAQLSSRGFSDVY